MVRRFATGRDAYLVNKILQPDGSVIDFNGKQLEPANEERAELYKNAPVVANKILNQDGTVMYFINGR